MSNSPSELSCRAAISMAFMSFRRFSPGIFTTDVRSCRAMNKSRLSRIDSSTFAMIDVIRQLFSRGAPVHTPPVAGNMITILPANRMTNCHSVRLTLRRVLENSEPLLCRERTSVFACNVIASVNLHASRLILISVREISYEMHL